MSYPPPFSAAPNYGQPPRKNRAGLFVVLMVVLLLGVLGTGGVLTYRLVSHKLNSGPGARPAAASSPTPQPTPQPTTKPTPIRSVPAPQPTKSVRPPTTTPTTKPPATPARPATTAAELARRFVAQLNANNPTAAAAYACQDSKQLIPILMGQYLQPPTRLTTGTSIGGQPTFAIRLSGTTKGSPVTGIIIIQRLTPEPLCVRIFSITPG